MPGLFFLFFLFLWKNLMKLTRRQETFMRQLLALYGELETPIHYSTLAERLGVSRITAYDMLRVLEEKGYAEAVYQLSPDRSGPGRSAVLYRPTEKANRAIQMLAAETHAPDWNALANDIIRHMRMDTDADVEIGSVTRDILDRLPPEGPPEIRYCTELITIIVLRLRHSQQKQRLCRFVSATLRDPEQITAADLNVLAGVSLGLFMSEKEDEPGWYQELLTHIKRYYQLVEAMTPEQRRVLARNLNDITALLDES